MRAKIHKSMIMLLTATLFISYMVFSMVAYTQNFELLKSEVHLEAEYIHMFPVFHIWKKWIMSM